MCLSFTKDDIKRFTGKILFVFNQPHQRYFEYNRQLVAPHYNHRQNHQNSQKLKKINED